MDKRTQKQKNKSHKVRCEFSGKCIGNKPVVLCENAVSYVRKLGFLVSNFRIYNFLFLFLFIIFSMNIVSPLSISENYSSNLVAYYSLDELTGSTAYDSTGNLNLTETGSTSNPNRAGLINKSWDFANDNNHLISSSNSGIAGNVARTIAGWIYIDTTANGILMAIGDNVDNKEFALGYDANDEIYLTGFITGDCDSGYSLNVSQWEFIAVTYDGSGNVNLYHNGLSIYNCSGMSYNTQNSPIRLGWRDSWGAYTDGSIDEVGLWDTILSSEQILNLYNNGLGVPYISEISCSESLLNTSWSSWSDTESCQTNDYLTQVRNLTQYDSNNCGTYTNETFFDYQESSCNYCSYNIVNTSWSSWVNDSCLSNDTMYQYRSLIEYDENKPVCSDVTGLPSDLWNDGQNETYFDFQSVLFCDYCSPNMTNSSWSNWFDIDSCSIYDNKTQNRTLDYYDLNNCGEVSNTTYYETQNTSCNYCSYYLLNTSWSAWQNQTIYCEINETLYQNRSLTMYDSNYYVCYDLTNLESDLFNNGLNVTYYEYRSTSCYEEFAISDSTLFDLDLTDSLFIVIFVVLVLIALLFAYLNLAFVTGFIFVILGFILLYSGFNFVISAIFLFLGVGATFYRR